MEAPTLKSLMTLCKRRGFIFHTGDLYGGLNGVWDYGPLGCSLKNKLRDAWWRAMVEVPPLDPQGKPLQIVGVDSAILQHPSTWRASGHVDHFSDPMVDCRESQRRYRTDHLRLWVNGETGTVFAFSQECERSKKEQRVKKFRGQGPYEEILWSDLPEGRRRDILGPEATTVGTLTAPKAFNLMFKTNLGAVEGADNTLWLRPETAQGIFTNFKNVVESHRLKLPFGIAQIGKAFRNEVTPRHFIFRSREFEQMELEWFCSPEEAPFWYRFWQKNRYDWWCQQGLQAAHLRLRTHDADEIAHYARTGLGSVDLEYAYPFATEGFGELEGIAHRGNHDLNCHQALSKRVLTQEGVEVIEPSAGLTRGVLALLCDSYTPDAARPSGIVLRLPVKLAPVTAAILPLTQQPELVEHAQQLFLQLRTRYSVTCDVKSSIGKRYARHDEIGTPLCITIDPESLNDQQVTVRYRDSMQQIRIPFHAIDLFLAKALQG